MRAGSGELRIGMIGAGTMAAAHSIALTNVARTSTRTWPMRPRLVAVADVNATLATGLAERFGYERVEPDWRSLVAADDIDLVVACLPPVFNREVVLAAAAAGKHVVCEKPLGASAEARRRDARRRARRPACSTAWRPATAGRRPSAPSRALPTGSWARSAACAPSFMLDYAADPDVPLLWRFRRDLAGGGIAIDTGYHLVDCARFLVGEIETVQAIADDLHRRPSAARRRRGRQPRRPAAWRRPRPSPAGRRRGCGRRPGHVRRRGVRRPRDEPRRDRQAAVAPARGLRVAWLGRVGPRAAATSSACACPATRPPSGSAGSS